MTYWNSERASQPQLRRGVSATQRRNGLPSMSGTSTGITGTSWHRACWRKAREACGCRPHGNRL
ncbi:Uncharacterised protein [Serratia fonticola]|nr:Uncharacterised protein [Serratia fonticola]